MAAPLLNSSQNLCYQEWQGEYQAALLEVDPQTLVGAGGRSRNSYSGAPLSDDEEPPRDAVKARRSKILSGSCECLGRRKFEKYISQVAERLNFLKRELDDLRQMNLRYCGHSEHSSLATAAYESRRLGSKQSKMS
jgi:hypothetical protein